MGTTTTAASTTRKNSKRNSEKLTNEGALGIFLGYKRIYSQVRSLGKAVNEGQLDASIGQAVEIMQQSFDAAVKRLRQAKDLNAVARHRQTGVTFSAEALANIMSPQDGSAGYRMSFTDTQLELLD